MLHAKWQVLLIHLSQRLTRGWEFSFGQTEVSDCQMFCNAHPDCNSFTLCGSSCYLKTLCVTTELALVSADGWNGCVTHFRPCPKLSWWDVDELDWSLQVQEMGDNLDRRWAEKSCCFATNSTFRGSLFWSPKKSLKKIILHVFTTEWGWMGRVDHWNKAFLNRNTCPAFPGSAF